MQASRLLALMGCGLLACLGNSQKNSGTAPAQVQSITFADATISGFSGFRASRNTGHFVAVHTPGSLIHFESEKRGLRATCEKAEGDVSQNNIILNATLSGGVHVEVQRPSGQAGSRSFQTATADAQTAVYSEKTNTMNLTGGVTLTDEDPAMQRVFHATGPSAVVNLAPQGTKGDAFRSATLRGPAVIDVKGMRLQAGENGAPAKRVPYTLHSTSDSASFDNIRRTITLEGHVHMVSDDPMVGESYVDSETILLNPDGSINEVQSGPGASTIDTGSLSSP